MANIQYTAYVNENKEYPKALTFDFGDIPIIGKRKPAQEVVLNPLPDTKTETEETPITAEIINWNDTSKSGKGRAARQYLMNALGLQSHQAAALVGSFMRESGLNINAENKLEKAGRNPSVKPNQYGIGIGQWTHNRHDDFVNWTHLHGDSLQSQLNFAIDEIQRKYPEYLAALKQASNSDEASDLTYVMYTGANHKNVTKANLANLVANLENKYRTKHIELYGKDSGNHSEARRKASREALSYKLGGVLKMQNAGIIYAPFNDRSNDRQTIEFAPKERPKNYVKQFNLADPPRIKDDGFDRWYKYVSQILQLDPDPDNPKHHYNYRRYYDEVVKPNGDEYAIISPNFHFTDKYKMPGHETFSIESDYYVPGMDAGFWVGDTFVKPENDYDRIVNERFRFAKDALLNNGVDEEAANRLSGFLVSHSANETGWQDNTDTNNYGGYLVKDKNGKRVLMQFDSTRDFWDYHIKNLLKKWPEVVNAKSIDEYYDTVNHTELGLTTKEKFEAYNRAHRSNPVYIYMPEWDNHNYRWKLNKVYNDFVQKYLK